MPTLFDPLTLRGLTVRNRLGVSPMCMYSSDDGHVNDFHLVHLGARALGGAGLIVTEASAVEAIGRISPADAGIYRDSHVEPWTRVTRFARSHGAAIGIQLAHAGRKASTSPPWIDRGAPVRGEGGWTPVGASAIPFTDKHATPDALDADGIARVVRAFADAARRAIDAGFEFIELHAAHGYLLHSFYSPLANAREDQYGGGFENRVRLTLEVVDAIRKVIPDAMPLLARLSCSDWTDGGWTIDDSVRLASLLRERGVDLIDCSSGGNVPGARIPAGPGYQVAFASAIRSRAGVATAAVGMIESVAQADTIVRSGQADATFIARASLREPNFLLGAKPGKTLIPKQYERAWD